MSVSCQLVTFRVAAITAAMQQKVTEAFPVYMMCLGCGDAFGTGGRLNTCFLVNRRDASFLIDCGASAMISIRRFGVDPNGVDAIILSHLHVDHFGGLPSFILDAQLVSRRTRPLMIAGPKGLGARLDALAFDTFEARVNRPPFARTTPCS